MTWDRLNRYIDHMIGVGSSNEEHVLQALIRWIYEGHSRGDGVLLNLPMDNCTAHKQTDCWALHHHLDSGGGDTFSKKLRRDVQGKGL